MDLHLLFKPIDLQSLTPEKGFSKTQLGSSVFMHTDEFPDLNASQIAIIGIAEERGAAGNKGCAEGPDAIRKSLYTLQNNFEYTITDLGNLINGHTLKDTYKALEFIVSELIAMHIFPLILGGGQDLTYAQFSAHGNSNLKIDLLCIDSYFDLDEEMGLDAEFDSSSFLTKVISHEPDVLFNYSNIGYQSHFVSQPLLRLMEKLLFDTYRLGELSGNIQDSEPVIRSAHLISFDVHAIRFSDAPGRAAQTPHGFYGEDVCQMFRYAGMSEQLSSLGIYEYNPLFDRHDQTSQLLAQMIWYFFEGFSMKKQDNPLKSGANFLKYRTHAADQESTEIIFFKSRKTGRWWMQVPYPERYAKNDYFYMAPCSYEDYRLASEGEVPDRWWKTVQKL